MSFELSVGGFFAFLFRPFTNPMGFIMLIGAIVLIWLRIKGKIGSPFDKKGNNNQQGYKVDYHIK